MRPIVLMLGLGSTNPQVPAKTDSWFGVDKVKHFFAAAFVQSVAYSTIRAAGASHDASIVGASFVTATVSIGKEVVDGRTGGTRSGRDLLWDAAGAAAATLLLQRSVH